LNFSDFSLAVPVMEGIMAMGYDKPTPIQEQAIPIILAGHDLIACAQTGTGKTAAFLLPVIHRLVKQGPSDDNIRVLIIAPTRELAIQIDQQLQGFAYFAGLSSIAIYGGGTGAGFEQEKKALQQGAQVIVATPGRLISHLSMGYVDFSNLQYLILDEADRMLDMGFLPDITRIISQLPAQRQTLLFSATMPEGIRRLSEKILNAPQQINLSVSKPAENVLQAAYLVHENQKIALVESLIQGKDLPLILIFVSTKAGVKEVESILRRKQFNVSAIHSDLEQEQRIEVMNRFKARKLQVLVATDIVSRGIDVDDISLVINYNVPGDAEDYVHRVGRTARAERSGVALTFVSEKEFGKFHRIEKFLGNPIRKLLLPAHLGEGPSAENYAASERQGRNRHNNGGFRKKNTSAHPRQKAGQGGKPRRSDSRPPKH